MPVLRLSPLYESSQDVFVHFGDELILLSHSACLRRWLHYRSLRYKLYYKSGIIFMPLFSKHNNFVCWPFKVCICWMLFAKDFPLSRGAIDPMGRFLSKWLPFIRPCFYVYSHVSMYTQLPYDLVVRELMMIYRIIRCFLIYSRLYNEWPIIRSGILFLIQSSFLVGNIHRS